MELHQTRGNTAELLCSTYPANVNIIGRRVDAILIVATIQVRETGGEGTSYIPVGESQVHRSLHVGTWTELILFSLIFMMIP